MRFRGFASTLVILSALAVPAATSSAQGPAAPTTFDGKYVDTVTPTLDRLGTCIAIRSIRMTITGGQVVIHEVDFNGGGPVYDGSINAAGEVLASARRDLGSMRTVSGTFHDQVFTGQRLPAGGKCYYSVQMAPAPAPTTPFDGDYRGVSREVSDSGGNEHHCNPRPLSPPRPLMITNGIVGIPGEWWQGTVGPQGAVAIRNPSLSRVDGQIDPQGTIRGQYSGELPPGVVAQINGGGTNCIIKFVWQKE